MQNCLVCNKSTFSKTEEFCKKCGTKFGTIDYPKGTVEAGIASMDSGNYAEGMLRWVWYIKKGNKPTDDEYELMIESASDCVIRQLSEPKYSSRDGLSDFGWELRERPVIEDLMTKLNSHFSGITTKRQLNRLAAEYMATSLNAFAIYPDLRDVIRIMRKAHVEMKECMDFAPTLVDDDKTVMGEMKFYVNYSNDVAEAINSRIYMEGREKMNAVVDYWSKQTYLVYAPSAISAAEASCKAEMAKVGAARKVKVKENSYKEFLDAYFDLPFSKEVRGMNKKKKA